ncbi:MAG: Response regulator PleD [Planctomycetes bacterium ADurb.Bin126]|nr:MAG: Response regulator PleD [Planctomycetes bacterium ADurb.Bin126]HQL75953.1 diguanylate cyclase [Phycisphaerae bacterium]
MGRLKLTSPGVLLICAVFSAGGIFLLDVFYLRPYVGAQKLEAVRQQTTRAERTVRQTVLARQDSLHAWCASWAYEPAVQNSGSLGGAFTALVQSAMAGAGVDLAWTSDDTGKVLRVASSDPNGPPMDPQAVRPERIEAAIAPLEDTAADTKGLLKLGDSVLMFASGKPHEGEAGTGVRLWVARLIEPGFCHSLCEVVGAETLQFAVADSLPPAVYADQSASHAVWPVDDEKGVVAAAWLVRDAAGRMLGYFRAELPMTHIHRLGVGARRMVLIILSLSVGLIVLIIMATHMLIAGPVVRLLRRLQKLEGGQGSPDDLSRDLHGEPLVLARRLESAFDRLAHISKTDQLTNLANRRHFQEVLDCFYHQARRYNRPLSLIVMDVDFFKAVNDSGGHQAGDELLKVVAAAIEQACRKADLPARLGGDEFAVLLPETGCVDAAAVAERIRTSVSDHAIKVRGLLLNVTVSIGITDLNAGEIDSPDAMVSLADKALYRAKELGRNRLVQANELDGLSWQHNSESRGKVGVLYKKLAGLDTQFKDLFLKAIEEIVEILAQRDPHMAMHAMKVQHVAVLIAREMELPERVIKRVETAAMLHDIGMLAMPDSVLLCPTELDEQKMYLMRRHPLLSVQIMEGMEFLEQEIPAVRYHHERFDGSGYPEGLAGAAIPLTARILAVADSFVAMTSPRTFRSARSVAETVGEIEAGSSTLFDPAVVEAFVSAAARVGDRMLEAASPDESTAHDEAAPALPAPGQVPDDSQTEVSEEPVQTVVSDPHVA